MCLKINEKYHKATTSHPRPLKAAKDIKVYKVLKTSWGMLQSPTYPHTWELEYIYHITNKKPFTFQKLDTYNVYFVQRGLHSYMKLQDAKEHVKYVDTGRVFHAVIPAGSLYFRGAYDDIVSNQLAIVKEYQPRKKRQPQLV